MKKPLLMTLAFCMGVCFTACEKEENVTPTAGNDMECVDLGLSVKWATCNVGASTPEQYGDFYAWGETETKEVYDWSNYKYCKGTDSTLTKYCNNADFGIVDNKFTLDLDDDVAHVKWGGKWRMPTMDEMGELLDSCQWTFDTVNQVEGCRVTGPNGNSIFLPVTGVCNENGLTLAGIFCEYLSSSLYDKEPSSCEGIGVDSFLLGMGGFITRCWGLSVRPVCE